jgi:tetratricopeptide (TPR) repeat protein
VARGAEGRRKPSLSPPAPSAAPGGPATSAIRFTTSAEAAASAPPVPPAEPHGWTKVWLGRTAEMAELAQALVEPRGALKAVAICAVQGMAGVGKTYLAERFAWEHAASFPGGVKRLALQPDRPADVARLLDELAAQLDAPARPDQIRARLLVPRALVHVDNADNEVAAKAAADLWRALPGCALVVTGRYEPLGSGGGWARVEVPPFDEATALALLSAEGRPPRPGEDEAFRALARELGCLPLALSLAAAHLREGLSPGEFLALLEEEELDVSLVDPAQGDDDPARRNLRKTFTLSLDLLRRSLGERGDALVHALGALGHAPLAGVGASLGAAITGLSATDFRRLTLAAVRLSVLERSAGDPPRWRLHPLLAKLVRDEAEAPAVLARTTAWFVDRLPEKGAADPRPQGERWNEVHEETVALADWLGRVPEDEMPAVERAGWLYAISAGPFALWATFCTKLLAAHEAPRARSNALFTLSWVARRAGDLDKAYEAATQKEAVDRTEGWEGEAAMAAGLRADIHQARGQLDEALHIRRHDELPVYEKLGDLHARAVTLGEIADIHMARGQLDEALHIRRHDQLPVFEKLGDIRERAVTLGRIADIHEARGQLDEALHIRRHDELPVFEKLGDLHSLAVTLGQIADIHMARGSSTRPCTSGSTTSSPSTKSSATSAPALPPSARSPTSTWPAGSSTRPCASTSTTSSRSTRSSAPGATFSSVKPTSPSRSSPAPTKATAPKPNASSASPWPPPQK